VQRAPDGATGMRRDTVTGQRPDATGRARRGAVATTPTEDALVARLEALSAEFAATPDEEFRAATRARLVAMAAVRTPVAEAAARRPPARAGMLRRLLADDPDGPLLRWRSRLTAALAGAALAVTAAGGLLGAAQQARPGDLLYDLKRGGEQTQLALAGDAGRGETLLEFASTRLDELSELLGVQPNADAVVGTTPSGGEAGLAADGPDVDLVLDTLRTMDEQTTEGSAAMADRAVEEVDAGALGGLTAWAGEQQSGLGELTDAMPSAAMGALDASLDVLDAVAARGAALAEAVACSSGPAIRGSDAFGPLPATCVPAAQATSGATSSSGPGASSSGTASSGGTSSSGSTSGTSGSSSAPSGTPSGSTGSPAPTTAPGPTTSGSGTSPGGEASTTAPPSSSPTSDLPDPSDPSDLPLPSVPSPPLPDPSLPEDPSLPISEPPLPGTTSTAGPVVPTSPSSGSEPLVEVSTVVPGVSVCVPPLIAIGC
jgi:Domain of unknown function (DUF5667)